MYQLDEVNKAFTIKSKVYDDYSKSNLIVKNSRAIVYSEILSNLTARNKILELNSGTGLDALFFASKGYSIHATDISTGMLQKIKSKINENNKANFTYQKLSLLDLENVKNGPYDYIFSNFGGMNCIPDINSFSSAINPRILNPGGFMTLTVMPRICPWEIMNFPWNFKSAFRRIPSFWGRETKAHIEGIHFFTYYYSVNYILSIFGKNFDQVSLRSLSLFSPPSFMDYFPIKYPKLYNFLFKIDKRLASFHPFNKFGDFFILTLRYNPKI